MVASVEWAIEVIISNFSPDSRPGGGGELSSHEGSIRSRDHPMPGERAPSSQDED